MAIVNLTPDSFWEPSRVGSSDAALERIGRYLDEGADIIDLGAVSTRPGSTDPGLEAEWSRLEGVIAGLTVGSSAKAGGVIAGLTGNLPRPRISIDTTRAEIVRRTYEIIGPFIVNDISAGEDDPDMLPTVGRLGLPYIAMHKRGNPRTMDSLCDYPNGIIPALLQYFRDFEVKASGFGIRDWILDPGLGFAKTPAQCWEILERLPELKALGRPVLIGAADKRFTRSVPAHLLSTTGQNSPPPGSTVPGGGTEVAHRLAILGGADILRVHEIKSNSVSF